jgi:pilus assembly protein Flp/PilA
MAQAMFRASEWRALENHMDLFTRMRAFGRDDSGQDLLEYALLIGLIALVTVLAVTNAGSEVNRIFGAIVTSLTAVA